MLYTLSYRYYRNGANLKEKDQDQIFKMKASITSCLKAFKPSSVCLSDVVEI
jgi:hypothetical protein